MTPSAACKELVKRFEGFREKAYLCPSGLWTCGWGHTKGVTPSTTCTRETAEAWLDEDLSRAGRTVEGFVNVPLAQNQFDALVSFVFNVGPDNFRKSTLLAKLNQGDFEGAAKEFRKWVFGTKDGKKILLAGLVKRRGAEEEMFRGGW